MGVVVGDIISYAAVVPKLRSGTLSPPFSPGHAGWQLLHFHSVSIV